MGNDLNIAGVGTTPKITAISQVKVAFIDQGNDDLRIYEFDGTDWRQISNDLNIGGAGALSITALSNNKIAFIDTRIIL